MIRFSFKSTRFATLLACAASLLTSSNAARADQSSWIFQHGEFSHDPITGARVAQYSPIAPVEPLDDPRAITSVYRRARTTVRGADGSTDSYYQVQSYGNGRGGLDAEWERFHDAWKESYTAGGYSRGRYEYDSRFGYAPRNGYGYGNDRPGFHGPGYGGPVFREPGFDGRGHHPGGGWRGGDYFAPGDFPRDRAAPYRGW